jgi:hypothetical protein
MITEEVETYEIKIYVGLRTKYTTLVSELDEAKELLRKEMSRNPNCVTITPTDFIYYNGEEPGYIIGLINYPRFPRSREEMMTIAKRIAQEHMIYFKQYRVSIVATDKTIMLTNPRL